MKMTKTNKTVYLRAPHNYWINRRVWRDEDGVEYARINGFYTKLDWFWTHDWDVNVEW